MSAGKDTGTIRFEDGGVTVIADLPKRIDWDQAQARPDRREHRLGRRRPGRVHRDHAVGLRAQIHGALPESWRKGFEPARTVRTGKPKFRFVLGDGGAS